MRSRRLAFMFVGLMTAVAAPVAAADQTAREAGDIVWCHDEDRTLVTRKEAWKCSGRIVTEAEAQRIRMQRVRRIQGQIKKPKPLFKGRRLRGTGSGFFITRDGYVLTNWHVIDNCRGISFTPAGGKALVSELVVGDKSQDLALLQVPYSPAEVAAFRAWRAPTRNERLFVIGYPLHGKVTVKPILRSGYLDEENRTTRPGKFAMKMDVRRGNSGGPVLDEAGRVVGVVVAKVNTPSLYAATGRLVRDLGIAIRLPVALQFLREQEIPFREAAVTPPLTDADLFARAHRFIGQVGCWR